MTWRNAGIEFVLRKPSRVHQLLVDAGFTIPTLASDRRQTRSRIGMSRAIARLLTRGVLSQAQPRASYFVAMPADGERA